MKTPDFSPSVVCYLNLSHFLWSLQLAIRGRGRHFQVTVAQRVALSVCGRPGRRLLPELLPPAPPVAAGSLPACRQVIVVSGQT